MAGRAAGSIGLGAHHDASLDESEDRFRPIGDLQDPQQSLDVGFHRPGPHAEYIGDLLVREPSREKFRNLLVGVVSRTSAGIHET